MLQPAAPRLLQHSHRGGKRTGIHSAHYSADLSHSCVCEHVCVCVSVCAFVSIVYVWDASAACGNKELISRAKHLYQCVHVHACVYERVFPKQWLRVWMKPWVIFMQPSLFIWIARAFLKPFVVDDLKMFERGFAEVASGTTVIYFNTHIATHTGTHSRRYNGQSASGTCVSFACML